MGSALELAKIVGAVRGRDAIYVWTDTSLFTMRFIGQPFTFGFQQVGTNCGLIGQNAALEVDGAAYWFSENGVRNISVYDVKLDEKYKIIPCKSLFFSFEINLNNQIDINLTLKKDGNTNYVFDFKIYDDTIKEERQNLSTMIQVIGETLKTKYI